MGKRAIFSILLLVVGALTAACASSAPPPAGPGTPQAAAPAGTGVGALPLNIDPATYVIVEYRRSGGIAGQDDQAQLYLDGHVVLNRRGQEAVTFRLSPAQAAQLNAAFEAADFYRKVQQEGTPPPIPPDAMQYEIKRRGALLQGTLRTHDGAIPDWAQPLVPLLDNLLLSPTAAAIEAAAQTPDASTVEPPPVAPLVLLEFVRTVPGGDEDRVLVNVDRTYSVSRGGTVEEGQLSEEEMAALLKLLEAADLPERKGEYLPEDATAAGTEYTLVYRNLFGAASVRSQDGSVPDWFQVIVDTLVDAFVAPQQVAAGPTAPVAPPASTQPAGTATAAPTATAAAPAATEAPTPAPTPTLVVTDTPTAAPAVSPTAAPPDEGPYALADLLAGLVQAGARVAPEPGRVVKPFPSVPGIILRVDGQPVQIFEYPDEAALLADVDGLAPNASSVDGAALTWSAAPHFWRKGQVLALAVTDDSALVDLLSGVLGEPFAGQE